MEIIKTITGLKKELDKERKKGRTIGYVPTMGFFHEGHLSLIKRCREECDVVVISIYVNPLQFGEGEDLQKYPRDIDRDSRIAGEAGVDYLFYPSDQEMYPEEMLTYIKVREVSDYLCGATREGHFEGVATVVAKLFNIVRPEKAYFGEKDYQQLVVVKKMTRDLNIGIEIKSLPTVREEDGLAMSSRNTYLSGDERKAAAKISRALSEIVKAFKNGERDCTRLLGASKEILDDEKQIEVEYLEIRDAVDLKSVKNVTKRAVVFIAVRIGRTRLIDNVILDV